MGFAGSRRLDDRRRRRIASEPAPKPKSKTRRIDAAHTGTSDQPRLTVEHGSPILTWLPRASWPMLVATLLSAICASTLLGSSIALDGHPVWGPVVGVCSGNALTTLSAIAMFASGQVCFVIYWYRKRSRRDFAGCYRRWLTAALTSFASAIAIGTGVHSVLGRIVQQQLPPVGWNTPEVCWTVPVGVLAAFLGPALAREIRSVGTGLVLFVAGLIAVATILTLDVVANVALSTTNQLAASRILSFVAAWCFFHAFWWHARHVCRVSNEPPPKGQIRAELKRLMPSRSRSESSDEADVADDSSSTNAGVEAEPSEVPRRRKRKKPVDDEPQADANSVESKPSLVGRAFGSIGAAALSPIRSFRSKTAAWKARRTEAAEMKRLAREEQKAEKAKAAEARAAEKQAEVSAKAEAKRAAAEAKAEEKRQASEAKVAAKTAREAEKLAKREAAAEAKTAAKKASESKASAKQANAETDPPAANGDQETADGQKSGMTAAERRAARKARKQKQQQQAASENGGLDELRDSYEDDEQDNQRRSKRKRRSR